MWEDRPYLISGDSLLDSLSPSPSPFINASGKIEPISPCLSSTGDGSPYPASMSGSMSPDSTYSPGGLYLGGSDGECSPLLESDVLLQREVMFGQQWPLQGTGGTILPPLHEWRKDKIYQQPLRFIFPNLSDVKFVSGSGKERAQPVSPECLVSSTCSPSSDRGKVKNRRKSSLNPCLVGERAEKFMKSFAVSTSSAFFGNNVPGPLLSSNGKSFDCSWIDCKASYAEKASLIDHIDRVHIQTRKDDFSCFWHGCVRRNRPFNARYKLLIHMRVHTGHKPNKCTVLGCDKAFSRLENLKIHLRSHTGERPYICPFCPKAFSNSSDRAKHQRTHFDSKPYACIFPDCVKRYTDPSSLRKHAKMHYIKKVVISKEEKKENKKNRRKLAANSASSISKCDSAINVVPMGSSSAATNATVHLAPFEEKGKGENLRTQPFMMGAMDPSLSQVHNVHGVESVSDFDFSLISPTTGPSASSPAAEEPRGEVSESSGFDLDGILMGDLDWIKGVNLDENLDIDCLI